MSRNYVLKKSSVSDLASQPSTGKVQSTRNDKFDTSNNKKKVDNSPMPQTSPLTLTVHTPSSVNVMSNSVMDIDEFIYPTISSNIFLTKAWQTMVQKLPADAVLSTIASIKQEVLKRHNKRMNIPYVAGVVEFIQADEQSNPLFLIIQDFSGEIMVNLNHKIHALPNSTRLKNKEVLLFQNIDALVRRDGLVYLSYARNNLRSSYNNNETIINTPSTSGASLKRTTANLPCNNMLKVDDKFGSKLHSIEEANIEKNKRITDVSTEKPEQLENQQIDDEADRFFENFDADDIDIGLYDVIKLT